MWRKDEFERRDMTVELELLQFSIHPSIVGTLSQTMKIAGCFVLAAKLEQGHPFVVVAGSIKRYESHGGFSLFALIPPWLLL